MLRNGQNAGFRVNTGVSGNKGFSYGATAYGRAGGFDGLVSGNFIKDKEYRGGRNYRNLEGNDKILNSALGGRGLLGNIGYSFNEDNRIDLSRRTDSGAYCRRYLGHQPRYPNHRPALRPLENAHVRQ